MARLQQSPAILRGFVEDLEAFVQALRVQGRTISALMLLNAKVESRGHFLGLFWYFVEPLGHILFWIAYRFAIRFIRGEVRGKSGAFTSSGAASNFGMSVIITGIVPFLAMLRISDGIGDFVASNKSLLQFPNVKFMDLILSQAIFNIIKMLLVAIFVFTIAITTGLAEPPEHPREVLLAFLVCVIFAVSFALALLGLANRVKYIGLAFGRVFYRVNYIAGGVIFPLQQVPSDIAYWLKFNPIAHCIDLFRTAYYPAYQGAFGSYNYVLIWSASLCFIGLVIERFAYRHEET